MAVSIFAPFIVRSTDALLLRFSRILRRIPTITTRIGIRSLLLLCMWTTGISASSITLSRTDSSSSVGGKIRRGRM